MDTRGFFRAISRFGTSAIQPPEVEAVTRRAPPGSLVRVNWVDELEVDELDPGIPLDQDGSRGELVLVTRYLPRSSFRPIDTGPVILEFECLWRGRIMASTSSCITSVVSKARL